LFVRSSWSPAWSCTLCLLLESGLPVHLYSSLEGWYSRISSFLWTYGYTGEEWYLYLTRTLRFHLSFNRDLNFFQPQTTSYRYSTLSFLRWIKLQLITHFAVHNVERW
jgi:hypothetical protein